MKIGDKRKVIEILLCNAQWIDGAPADTTWNTSRHLSLSERDPAAKSADRAWREVANDRGFFADHHSNMSLEAAYRLIESSATLRREWFGRPK